MKKSTGAKKLTDSLKQPSISAFFKSPLVPARVDKTPPLAEPLPAGRETETQAAPPPPASERADFDAAAPPPAAAPKDAARASGILRYLVPGATAALKPAPKQTPALPLIADDNDAAIAAFGKQLAELPLLSRAAAAVAFVPPPAIHPKCPKLDTTENSPESIKTPPASNQKIEDLGSKGRIEAQFWLDTYAGVQTDSTSGFEAPPINVILKTHPRTRSLNISEFMDLQMITDFAKEFGAGLLNFTVPNDFCLASFYQSFEAQNHTKYLPSLYTCLIKTIQHEKRWQTMTTLVETPALIIHHLLTVPLPATQPLAVTAPSIDAIITFFTDLTLPEIPAPVHVHLLTLLVSQLMEMEKFHDFMEDEVVKNMESKRKQMVANGKRRTEVKGLFKTTEAEIETEGVEVRKLERELKNVRAKDATTVEDSAEKMDDIVCEEDGVGKMDCDIVVEIDESGDPSNVSFGSSSSKDSGPIATAKPDRLSSREAEKKRRAAEYAINSKLSPLVKELNKKVTKLASLEREVQDLDRDDLELKQEIEALGSGLRVSRFLGMDRNYSSYFWIDLGSAEETAETSTSAKRYCPPFGILVLETKGSNSEEDQPQTQNIRYINTIVQLKQLLKTLNDRGIRERDLLTHLRDRLKPYSLEFPAFPTTGNKRSWDRLGPADAENQVNKFFNRFGECLEGLGGLKDGCQDENVGEYREQVVEGVRERIRDLVLVMGVNKPTEKAISAMNSMDDFVEGIVTAIKSVYGPEESEEVKERFEGVTNMCLFSVAVGFVVRDVKAGKFSGGGADLEKKEGDTHERKKGSLDDDDDGSELKPRSCRARTVLPVIAKPEPRVMIKSDRSSRKARRDRLSKSIVQQKRTTRSSAKALDEESETDEITVQLTDGESDDDVENSDGNSESASDNDSDDSSQSIEEVIAAPAISRRKRNSSELDDHQVGRMTRSRHGSESKAPDAVDNNRKIEAIAKLAQSRSERIARRSK